jgi:hypothetical protein
VFLLHWLFMRPAVGWGAFLIVHAVGIPLVYVLGRACGMKKARKNYQLTEPPVAEQIS